MQQQYDQLLKVVLAGPSQSGKTSLFNRFRDSKFNMEYLPTIGVDFTVKTITVLQKIIKLQIWDTSGQQRFSSISTAYYKQSHKFVTITIFIIINQKQNIAVIDTDYKGANIIYFSFDLTNINSFELVKKQIINSYEKGLCSNNCTAVLIGMKLDCVQERKIKFQHANEIGNLIGQYFEISSLSGENIDLLFHKAAQNKLLADSNPSGTGFFMKRMENNKNNTAFQSLSSCLNKNRDITQNNTQLLYKNHVSSEAAPAAPGQSGITTQEIQSDSIINKSQQNTVLQAPVLKVLFVGEQKVGKTTILNNYVNKKFIEDYKPTIGVDFATMPVNSNNSSYKLQIWDTAGQERFRVITRAYYKGSRIVYIVYDITNLKSFEQTKQYIEQVKELLDIKDLYICLVGNKKDLESQVSTQLGMKLAEQYKIDFMEVSAKNYKDMQRLFLRGVQYLHSSSNQQSFGIK